jgi:iron(II)-dependent oxidoreductase
MAATSGVYSALGSREARALRQGGAADVREALRAVRARTLELADAWEGTHGLRVGYDPGLNPPLWEWGHVAWFQEWWVARNPQRSRGAQADPDAARPPPLLPGADALYDSSRVAHRARWDLPLADAAGTRAYLQRTLEATLDLLDALPPGAGDDALYFFRLAALHEAMHAEAAAYMARALGFAVPMAAAPAWREAGEVHLPAQSFRLGASEPGFAFDNELPHHVVPIAACRIDAQPVTWARFLPFVEQGGYTQARWWSEEGLAWLRTLREPPAPRGAPDQAAAHLSLHEAEAWCRWAGRRLPTEAEWECAALAGAGFEWGGAWEWTASAFLPFEGFVAHPYRDYSAPWFGTRRVLRGAAAATSPWLAHARYRNFFEPHRRDAFSGFRSAA